MDSLNTFPRQQANAVLRYSISFFLVLLILSIVAVFAHPSASNLNIVDQNIIHQNDLLIAGLEGSDLAKAQAKRMSITGVLILLLILVFAVKIIMRIRKGVKGEEYGTTIQQSIATEEPVPQLKKSAHQPETGGEERSGKEKTQFTR